MNKETHTYSAQARYSGQESNYSGAYARQVGAPFAQQSAAIYLEKDYEYDDDSRETSFSTWRKSRSGPRGWEASSEAWH